MQRRADFDNMKVIGIILVLLAHSTHLYTGGWAYTSPYPSNFFNIFTWYIYSFHMPLFVFISGAVFCYASERGKYPSLSKLFVKKIHRLLIPYLFVGLVYMIPLRIIIGYYKGVSYKSLAFDFLTTIGSGHLWYLYVLFVLTIIFWLLRPIIGKRKTYLPIFALSVILYFISPRLPIKFLIGATAHFFIYFYVGYLFQTNRRTVLRYFREINYKTILYTLIVQLLIFFLLRVLTENQTSLVITGGVMIFEIFLAMIGVLLLYLVVNAIMSSRINFFNFWPLAIIKKYNMSIYLLHEPIIFAILSYIAIVKMYPFLIVSLCFFGSLITSLLLAKIISKNKFLAFAFGS